MYIAEENWSFFRSSIAFLCFGWAKARRSCTVFPGVLPDRVLVVLFFVDVQTRPRDPVLLVQLRQDRTVDLLILLREQSPSKKAEKYEERHRLFR